MVGWVEGDECEDEEKFGQSEAEFGLDKSMVLVVGWKDKIWYGG